MVRRLLLGNKDSAVREYRSSDVLPPPPPYVQSGTSPIILAGTTTTTTEVVTTTTHTTTHFFSLPLWRKRGIPAPTSAHQTIFHIGADENGMISPETNSSSFMLEKDLPPTPSDEIESTPGEGDARTSRATGDRTEIPLDISFSPTSFPISDSRKSSKVPVSQSTFVLAHAALGLGLPHVMPYASPSSSSSEVNTVAFLPSTAPQRGVQLSAPGVRRAKSSQKFRADASPERPSTTEGPISGGGVRRRTRGLSLGTSSFLNFGVSDAKGKGKEEETDESHPGQPSRRTVSRRPSFWTRKQHGPSSSASMLPISQRTSPGLHFPVLPSVHPVSPFNVDLRLTSASSPPHQGSNPQHSRRLSRSCSERASSSRPKCPTSDEVIPDIPRHIPTSVPASPVTSRRPATAGAPARCHARSMFIDVPHLWTSSPSPTPSALIQETFRQSQSSDSDVQSTRRHSQTNPPILHRLSLNLFSPSAPLPSPSTPSNGKSPAMSSSNSLNPSPNKHPVDIPKPLTDDESPEVYLTRLVPAVSKAEVAAILASSADPFYVRALSVYIEQFDFVDDPLDVALRKLLMDVGLPRETQQIDRVIEAFAGRYLQCNPNLFISEDHPYILAFSLIMLHTDVFNKSNKRKMTKSDYIKNTRLPGVAPEVLDCLYDNIVFAPFIFIEDPLDVNGQRGLIPEGANRTLTSIGNPTANGSGTTLLGRGNKVDPYYLITHKLLAPLRVNIEAYIPLASPYSYEGTAGPWDEEELQRAFAKANVIEVGAVDHTRVSPFFSLSISGPHSPYLGNTATFPEIAPSTGEIWTLKVTKVGLLNRKDDILEGGKRAMNRKWKFWSVILTGSQLLLFRDPSWATTLLAHSYNGQIIFPQTSVFKPDELLSVKDAIAVFDRSYTKHENTLRLVIPDGRQFLLQASDERELNEWISRINYASAFKSAGVRMRPLGMSGQDVERTGVAAATSHLHDMQHQVTPRVGNWDGNAPHDLMDMLSGDPSPALKKPPLSRKVTMMSGRDDMDLEAPTVPEVDGADQFKATFDKVKAELASGLWTSSDDDCSASEGLSRVNSAMASPIFTSGETENSRLPSRSQIIQSKVHDLRSKISVAQSQLDSDMRFIRNIATLTPFQRSTRDRLQVAVHGVAKRMMQVRLDIAKLICHREVLSNDLEAEGRYWHQAKKIALRAATETLQSRHHTPRMTPSLHNGEMAASVSSLQPIPQNLDTPSSRRPESSTCESFHSALDFGPDWPSSSENIASSSFLSASRLFDSPRRSSSGSLGFSPLLDEDDQSREEGPNLPFHDPMETASPRNSDELQSHERFYTAHQGPEEQAEEWDKTRCAQRVSLVRLPSDIRLSMLFERHGHSRHENNINGTASADGPSS